MPHYGTFKELGAGNRCCTCCERELTGHALRWLELDQRSNTYHDCEDVPRPNSDTLFHCSMSPGVVGFGHGEVL